MFSKALRAFLAWVVSSETIEEAYFPLVQEKPGVHRIKLDLSRQDNNYRGSIYKLYFFTGGFIYVGSTVRKVEVRYEEHLEALRAGTHYNKRLQMSFAMRGEKDLRLLVLETLTGSLYDIRKREGELIRKVDPKYRANYNLHPELEELRNI